MRKYPPITVLSRKAIKDYPVPEMNVVIEKGTFVFIPNYAIQHDPEYYPEPETFNPDRFDTEEKKLRNPLLWLPFGDGPRNFIGSRFGLIQVKVGLVSLLNNFEVSLGSKTSGPLRVDSKSIVLTSEGGVYLNLEPIIA